MQRHQKNNGWRLITADQIFPREILARLADTPLAERGAAFKDFAENSLSLEQEGSLLWLSEFSLRMASAPDSLENWAGSLLAKGINTLLDAPSLACTARFFILAVDQMRTVPTGAGEIYAGWGWS